MPAGKQTILYVDDDQDDLMIITDAFRLHDEDIVIITALNGEEALCTLSDMKNKDSNPSLIILDINMPLLNGKELLKQLKQSSDFVTIPIVLLSTSNNPDDQVFAKQHSTEFYSKPSTYPEMQLLIKQLASKCSLA